MLRSLLFCGLQPEEKTMLRYSEIVKVVHLEPIQTGSGSLHYRLEISKDSSSGKFSPILWRRESYRIQPTFPQRQGSLLEPPCDEEILVRDITTVDLETIEADDPEVALQMALKVIAAKFG
jgi:hypothetical protein